jgi:membrane protease subunit HflC
MNNPAVRLFALIALGIVLIAVYASTFVVHQTEQALVLRFGGVRKVVEAPGLYFKVPLIETVVSVDKRILDLDLPVQEVIAADQKRLVVDTFTRYRVTDPLRFYQTVNSVVGANLRLTSIVNSTTRQILADASFTSIVRNDRADLMKKIRDEVNGQANGLGIEVVDVRLRRVDLPDQNSEAVYKRMQTERKREAADIRAQGQQIAQGIRARADREAVVIVAEANRKSEELRGQGDAERNRIYAEAYGKDPGFFSFYRSMQAYETGLKPADTRLILSPDSDFFRYFGDPSGKGGNAATAPANAATVRP